MLSGIKFCRKCFRANSAALRNFINQCSSRGHRLLQCQRVCQPVARIYNGYGNWHCMFFWWPLGMRGSNMLLKFRHHQLMTLSSLIILCWYFAAACLRPTNCNSSLFVAGMTVNLLILLYATNKQIINLRRRGRWPWLSRKRERGHCHWRLSIVTGYRK